MGTRFEYGFYSQYNIPAAFHWKLLTSSLCFVLFYLSTLITFLALLRFVFNVILELTLPLLTVTPVAERLATNL